MKIKFSAWFKNRHFGLIFLIGLFYTTELKSQILYEPLNHQLRNFNAYPEIIQEDEELKSSSFHPNLCSDKDSEKKIYYRSYIPVNAHDSAFLLNEKYKQYSWLRRKLLYENFIIIDTGILYITIDPLINVSQGHENLNSIDSINPAEGRSIYNNTRGILLKASIGTKLSFESYFYENQSSFPLYIQSFTKITEVVPGQGRVKKFKEGDFDYALSGAYFSYAPGDNFNLQFGHHKQFIGDGYRSLILSDNSFNYPFLRLNFSFLKNKLKYTVLYTSFQNLVRRETNGNSEGSFERKGGTYHYLEYEFNKKFRIHITQGMIWSMKNSKGDVEFDKAFVNPLILSYPLVKGLDDKNNVILGLGFKFNPIKRLEIYSQFVVDDNKFNNTAFQMGTRIFVAKKAFIQLEGNVVSEYMYESNSLDYNNTHGHYNQALAHTLGNNFSEIIVKAGYRYKRIVPDVQFNYSIREYGSSINILWAKMELAYLLNPATNLKIFSSYTRRSEIINSENSVISNIFYFGIKTDLRNIYYDF